MVNQDFLKKHKCVKSINVVSEGGIYFTPNIVIRFKNDTIISIQMRTFETDDTIEKNILNEINNYNIKERYDKINKIISNIKKN